MDKSCGWLEDAGEGCSHRQGKYSSSCALRLEICDVIRIWMATPNPLWGWESCAGDWLVVGLDDARGRHDSVLLRGYIIADQVTAPLGALVGSRRQR